MEKYIDILRKCSLFYKMEEKDMLNVIRCLGAKVKTFEKKATIMEEGSPAKSIGIVLTGSVQIIQIDYYGNRSILSHVEPSHVFAEAFACAEVSSIPVTVVANEPCEIMLINCNRILNVCTNGCSFHQQLIYNLMKELATRTIMFQQKIEITSKRTTREKLMTYLMIQAKKAGSNSFEIAFDRQELADYLEVDRSGLSAEIGKLRKEGIIESNRKYFRLL